MPRLILFLLCLVLAACGGKKDNSLRVGMELTYPPFEMKDAQGNPDGVGVKMAEALAAELGRPLKIVPMEFTGLMPAVERVRRRGQLAAGFSFWPLGWIMTIGVVAVDGAADVSSWFQLDYRDKALSEVVLPVQFVYEYPGDFRRPDEFPDGKWERVVV